MPDGCSSVSRPPRRRHAICPRRGGREWLTNAFPRTRCGVSRTRCGQIGYREDLGHVCSRRGFVAPIHRAFEPCGSYPDLRMRYGPSRVAQKAAGWPTASPMLARSHSPGNRDRVSAFTDPSMRISRLVCAARCRFKIGSRSCGARSRPPPCDKDFLLEALRGGYANLYRSLTGTLAPAFPRPRRAGAAAFEKLTA